MLLYQCFYEFIEVLKIDFPQNQAKSIDHVLFQFLHVSRRIKSWSNHVYESKIPAFFQEYLSKFSNSLMSFDCHNFENDGRGGEDFVFRKKYYIKFWGDLKEI